MEYKLAIIIMVLLIMPIPSLAINNGYARVVYNVRGLQDYDLHWNDRFPPGSTIKIYAEADGVNHKRAAAVDYIFIIKDSNNNIVDTASYSNRHDDYTENDFIIYSKDIPQSWEDGIYSAEIHIFDLLNDSLMDTYYNDLASSYLNGADKPDLPVMNRSDAAALENQQIIVEKTFFVDRYADKYPVDRFRIEDAMLNRTNVAPNTPVQVSANVTNTFYDKGSTSINLLLDNKLVDNTTIEIEGYTSKQVVFNVSTEAIGNHTIELIPTGNNTIGQNLFTIFNVSTGNEIEVPTELYFKDIQIDRLTVEPNKTVAITVTVENKGKEGSQPVDLYINNMLEEERQVHLNFSETTDVKFEVKRADIGAYRATVGTTNLSKVFFVEAATPVQTAAVVQEVEKESRLKPVLGLSVLVVLIYIVRVYLKKRLK